MLVSIIQLTSPVLYLQETKSFSINGHLKVAACPDYFFFDAKKTINFCGCGNIYNDDDSEKMTLRVTTACHLQDAKSTES